MKTVRILVADDHALVRTGIATLLKSYEEFTIVGEASDGAEAIEMVGSLRPDLALIDLSMPNVNGIEATRTIRERFPSTYILVLTMHENDEYIYQILKAGADGYVLKDSSKDELRNAIHTVIKGKKYFSSRVSEIMMESFMKRGESVHLGASQADIPLTKREREILALVVEGLTNQQIASRLFISPRTVDTHRTNIMQKLDLHDVASLVRYAIRHGLVSPR